jgi:proline dehydrogenase
MSLRRRALFSLATSPAFEEILRRVPGGTDRAWESARRYVAGPRIEDALAVARSLAAAGLDASVDLFGERVTDDGAARAVAHGYRRLCARLDAEAPAGTWLSLDLSHLAFSASLLDEVASAVPTGRRLQIGAEEAATADRVLDLVVSAARRKLPVEATVQANLRRSDADAERLAGEGVPIRLVKGAYVEDDGVALPWGQVTDEHYADLAIRLARGGADVALATHDAALRSWLLRRMPSARCELLLGVSPEQAGALRRSGHDVRIYVPYGPDWLRYFMRLRAEAQGA